MDEMRLVFTSYRDSLNMEGLKLSLDKKPPKYCPYPVVPYLAFTLSGNLSKENVEKICTITLDNNWSLVQTLLLDMYGLGIRKAVMCCWCTKEQIDNGKFCSADMIGRYIESHAADLYFPIKIEYGDGRE